MSFDRIVVNPLWPWPVSLGVAALLVAVVLTTYPQRVRHLPAWTRRTLLGLRIAAALVLCLAIVRPEIQFRADDREPAVLYVLADASRSTSTPDAPGGKTRREAIVQLIEDNRGLLEQLGEDYEIRWFDYSAELHPVEQFATEAEGNQTAIGAVLAEVEREAAHSRLAGILLLGDGAQRVPPGQQIDPRDVALRLGRGNVPIYTVGFGGAGLSQTLDLAIEDLEVDPLPFEKNVVPVRAKLRVSGAVGRRLEVRLLVEDRAGKRPGEAGEMKVPPAMRNAAPSAEVQPGRESQVIPVELSYIPTTPGEVKLAVEVVSLAGELKRHNNQQATIITVQRGGISIAYFDHPTRPEQKWIRLANRSRKIQLDFLPVPGGQFEVRKGAVSELFEPGRYDAFIIGHVPAELFGEDNLRELRSRIDEGAGLLMIGGYLSFDAGGYADTPLADVLPVAMSSVARRPDSGIDPQLHYRGQLQIVPTDEGIDHYLMRLDTPENNLARWQALPPMEGANRLRRKNNAVDVLAETAGAERIPLLFTHEVGRARVMAFGGDSTWLWALGGHDDEHQRFWQQMLLYLARKEAETDQPVWARVEPRNFAPKQTVEIEVGARDAEGRPVADATFQTEVLPPAGEPRRPAVESAGERTIAPFSATGEAGDYWVRVSATKDGRSLGPDAWTRFVVDARDLELDNPAADPDLLEAISQQSGGRRLQPDELNGFLEQLLERGLPNAGLTRIERLPLWENWPFLAVFVALMTAEWFVRKRKGLV